MSRLSERIESDTRIILERLDTSLGIIVMVRITKPRVPILANAVCFAESCRGHLLVDDFPVLEHLQGQAGGRVHGDVAMQEP